MRGIWDGLGVYIIYAKKSFLSSIYIRTILKWVKDPQSWVKGRAQAVQVIRYHVENEAGQGVQAETRGTPCEMIGEGMQSGPQRATRPCLHVLYLLNIIFNFHNPSTTFPYRYCIALRKPCVVCIAL